MLLSSLRTAGSPGPRTSSAKRRACTGGADAGLVAGTAIGTALFVGSEATSWLVGAWEAVGVTEVAHVALYVVPAEILLSASIVVADRRTRDRHAG
jgi:hypothetical protein